MQLAEARGGTFKVGVGYQEGMWKIEGEMVVSFIRSIRYLRSGMD